MEMLPAAVQVLIEWVILMVATISQYFEYLFGKGDKTEETTTE